MRPLKSIQLDYEAEMVVVIGKRAKHLTMQNAFGCVAGYTCANEGSVREYQRHTTQWGMGKNFDKTGSFGPWMVSADELPPGGKGLKIESRLNGKTMQSSNTVVRQQILGYKKAVETLIAGDTDKALEQLASLPMASIDRTHKESIYHLMNSSVIEAGKGIDGVQKELSGLVPLNKEPLALLKEQTPVEAIGRGRILLTAACRDNTIVIIHENKNREYANRLIRNALMNEGSIGFENKSFPRLVSTSYTTAELYCCETYKDCLSKEESIF